MNDRNNGVETFITAFEIEKLYGMYDYKPTARVGESSQLLILYGDNGSGKTTILKLIFSLFSLAPKRGHRTFIARTPFRRFRLTLGHDFSIEVKKLSTQLVGSFEVLMTEGRRRMFQGTIVANEKNRVVDESSVLPLMKAIRQLGIDVFYLSDDRKTQVGTSEPMIEDLWPSSPDELSEYLTRNLLLTKQSTQKEEPSLDIAIGRLETWVRNETLKGSLEGEVNANMIYSDVVKRIARSRRATKTRPKPDIKALLAALHEIQRRSTRFSGYTPISAPALMEITQIFETSPKITQEIIANVLKPYVDAMRARLNSLQGVQNIVGVFLDTINSFLHHKTIFFDADGKLRLINRDSAELLPNMLSSGEQQLLLLFCNTVTARDQASIFIIDEPEISLNVKWQRKLLDALLTSTKASAVQFLIATHSLELLSRHKDHVLRLVDTSSR